MKLGLFGINVGLCADPRVAARVAAAAEAAGFESLWTGEHVVLPKPQVPPSPAPPQTPFLDPAVALAFLAAHTERIRLGTGIIILPQRNPLVLAKELASLDVVSAGRLIFGVGIGYLRPEFEALGIPFANKGARSVEYLQAMLAMWTQAEPRFAGRFVSFADVEAMPRPLQKPHPPIVFGGMSEAGMVRAIRHAQGWYGFALDEAAAGRCIAQLGELSRREERPAHLGPLEISVTPRGALDRAAVARFAALGVQRLIPYPLLADVDAMLDFVKRTADEVL